jgi:hypothetical protein
VSYLEDFFDRRKSIRQSGKNAEQVLKEDQKLLHEQRERFLNYKKFFGEPHGQEVMMDLMNKFHVLTPLPQGDALTLARAEGKREVVLYLLSRANMDIAQLDKLLKGEFI